MALVATFHGRYRPQDFGGARVDILGPQDGDAISIADGEVKNGLTAGFYEIEATTDCVVRIGFDTLANATGGRAWAAGKERTYYVPSGGSIACDAVA